MMPTNTYNTWMIVIQANVDSTTYFGPQDTNLMFTFRVLFIASLGCVYLYLGKNMVQGIESNHGQRLASWSRTVLARRPLGIVSWTELAFLVVFIALLIWSFSTYLTTVALSLALVGNVCLSFLFFPMIRGSSASIKYHIWLGHTVMTIFSAYGLCFIIKWAALNRMWEMFELFLYTHHLYILFIFFFILHVGIIYACMMLPGFYLFLVDRLSYGPMSFMFINVPSISKLQWHPFTITSNSNMDQDKLSVVVKSEGSWTKKLYQTLSFRMTCRHDMLVMECGGSGITPFVSIIREFIFKTTLRFKSPRVLLVCSFKNSSSLTMLDLLLPMSNTPSNILSLQLQIEAYVTREEEPISDKDQLKTLCFKPIPNSWLWLGLIISSSFIIFFIFLGLLTRYYIYPIDQNNNIYPYSSRALLNMLLLCICIAITDSAALLWNKKQRALEVKQIQNEDSVTPKMTSPYSLAKMCICILIAEILLECEGSSVEVMAAGPKKLRQEVAKICASGLANNLHFESLSFTW
ncbi:hypothetical protein NE237_018133 [Protea cynaroides]|uniref:Uncharacterized protein n=1 Tax=Protea cynaroides TaxID=273540 RepID=A0A9Q0QNW6_9MAGN|nr:hypothetical protein NE237_018133 [Protea cynaroides]